MAEVAEEDKETERKSRRGKMSTITKKKNLDYDEENAADIEDADERGDDDQDSSPGNRVLSDKKVKGVYKEDINESSQGTLKVVDPAKRRY